MTEDRLPHRLTVVWFTDLVGYSSLMGQDEDRAIALSRMRIRWARFGRDLGVIVLGVLVALAVDNYSAARTDRQLERDYLIRLDRDLRTDSVMLAEYLIVARRGQEASAELLRFLSDSRLSAVDSVIARDLSDATRGAYLAANRPTFSELTSTGSIRLIRDDQLRNGLFNYYASVERYQRSLETVMKRGKDPLGELGWDINAYDAVLGYAVNLGRALTPTKAALAAMPAESVALVDRFRRVQNAAIATRRALTYNGMLQPIVAEWVQSLEEVRSMLPRRDPS